MAMAEQRNVGTREEWQAARDELAKLEAEQAERNKEIKRKRRELPWVPVEKEYVFDTEDGKKSLADRSRHAARSQQRTQPSARASRRARRAASAKSGAAPTASRRGSDKTVS